MSRMDFRPAAVQERQDQPRAAAVAYVVGVSPEMQTVQRLIAEIAPTDIPVLLMGESGTGKEIVALHIHDLSAYRDLPFVKLSCAAFTPESLRSQIEQLKSKGRDKHEKRVGTLFLDEVSELDTRCQRNLLQCVPDGNDSSRDPLLSGRFISCTTQNLETEVSSGRFRSELFYRLNQICLRLPPLRNRKEDIPLLAQFFLNKYSTSFHRQEMSLSEKTLQLLIDYPWPGNIRETRECREEDCSSRKRRIGHCGSEGTIGGFSGGRSDWNFSVTQGHFPGCLPVGGTPADSANVGNDSLEPEKSCGSASDQLQSVALQIETDSAA